MIVSSQLKITTMRVSARHQKRLLNTDVASDIEGSGGSSGSDTHMAGAI